MSLVGPSKDVDLFKARCTVEVAGGMRLFTGRIGFIGETSWSCGHSVQISVAAGD